MGQVSVNILQEAGTVLHLARSGRLILKSVNPPPREGSVLVDEKGRRACKVLEIIGPISSPYLSTQPMTDRVERIAGSKLFVSEVSSGREIKRVHNRKFAKPRERPHHNRRSHELR